MLRTQRIGLLLTLLPLALFAGCTGDPDSAGEPVDTAADAVCAAPTYDEFIDEAGLSGTWASLPANLGNTDITSTLQTMLDNLPAQAQTGGVNVLYIPAGHYMISNTLRLVDGMGVSVVGEDPATTVLTWTGAAGADMIRWVDTSYAKLSRITLDGGGKAAALVHVMQSACYTDATKNAYCNLPVPSSPLVGAAGGLYGVEFNDDVFQNADEGIFGDFAFLPGVTPESCPYTSLDTKYCAGGVRGICCPDGTVWQAPPAGTIATVNSNTGNFVIRRSTFDHLAKIGVGTANQNALDWLVADSAFSNIGFTPVTTNNAHPAAAVARYYNGSYVLTNNSFRNDNRDIALEGPASDVIRGNSSIGSNAFLLFAGGWTFQADVSSNYVSTSGTWVQHGVANECYWEDPVSHVIQSKPYAICAAAANVTLFDNYITAQNYMPGSPTVAVYTWGHPSPYPAEIVEGGNTFRVGTAFEHMAGLIDARVVNIATDVTASPWTIPAEAQFAYDVQNNPQGNTWGSRPAKAQRTVFNAQLLPGSNCLDPANVTCSAAINTWLATAPQGSALYFPAAFRNGQRAQYTLTATLEVPAGRDVTLFGDGWGSQLSWRGNAQGAAMIHFAASAVGSAVGSVRDLNVYANVQGTSRPAGIRVDTLDLDGDMVFIDQVTGNYVTGVIDMNGLDHTLVRADQTGGLNATTMLTVKGAGAGVQSASATKGVAMFAGGGAALGVWGDVQNWGRAVLVGTDNEGYTNGFDLSGSGYITMDGGRLISAPDPNHPVPHQPDVLVEAGFLGHVTFMNLDDHAAIVSTANPNAHTLSMSNGYDSKECDLACTFDSQQNPTARANNIQMGFFDLDDCIPDYYGCNASPGLASDPVMPPPAAGAFVASQLVELRATRAAPGARPCNVANVRIHRVNFQGIPSALAADYAGAAVRVQHN